MNTQTNTLPAAKWAPYEITAVEASEDEPRMGFIGRAVALYLLNGVEVILLAKNDADLLAAGKLLTHDAFDPTQVYKATLIHSTGIGVVLPAEEPAAPALVPEEPLNPVVQDGTLVRGEDGVPVATYAAEADQAEATEAFADEGEVLGIPEDTAIGEAPADVDDEL